MPIEAHSKAASFTFIGIGLSVVSSAKSCLTVSRIRSILRAGPAYSRVMATKANKMLDGDFTPQARLAQHWKDVRLILSAGEQSGATPPLSTLHEELLSSLVQAGFGELDNSAVIKAFQKS